ncbi:hypothetical protein [Herbaspirillum sp. 1130]|uniref:hypothetical protein n=1 Tax=Herbaspirillum sp. 1130 TaxID=2806562 RepID=UPI001AE5AB41|nr:hypothetical protein [Herbaspirillum sp. 1130]MBP1316412.1 hypothetical protein [Herbaspirillum sp. 1130]
MKKIFKPALAVGILLQMLLNSNPALAAVQCDSCKSATGEAEICPPASTTGFAAVEYPPEFLAQARASRNTMLSGYTRRDPYLDFTIFLMDREGDSRDDDIKDMAQSVSGVRSLHEGVLMFFSQRGTLNVGGQSMASMDLGFFWTEEKTGEKFVTAIWGVPMGRRMLKIWVTFPPLDKGAYAARKAIVPEVEEILGQICR